MRRFLPRVRARRLPRQPVITESSREDFFDEEGRIRTFRLPRPVINILPPASYLYDDEEDIDEDSSTVTSTDYSDVAVQPGGPRPGFLPYEYF